MYTKNWRTIAAVGNEQLRMVLIAAGGDIAEGLKRGFPQYFLRDGETHPRPTRVDFVRIVKQMERRVDVMQAVKDADLPHRDFGFRGTCNGITDDIPYVRGGYDTVAHGWGEYYWRSTRRQGETLVYEGAEWLIVWNGYSPGDIHRFSRHSLVIVPEDALA